MKEHSLFMAVSFPPKNEDLIQEAKVFNIHFNNLLIKALTLASGVSNIKNDAVTQFTLEAEKATSFVTGFPIDTSVTSYELTLINQPGYYQNQSIVESISALNNESIQATQGLINYKSKVINGVLNCQVYTTNYPLLLDHIRREAIFFVDLLTKLQYRVEPNVVEEALRQEIFWNQIMSEHAKFIRGYLDPTEEELIQIANNFGNQFDELNNKAFQVPQYPQQFPQITSESVKLTKDIQGFKVQGTEGILNCKVKSLIVPLLGDHVIREANHYLNLLERITL
ncbi:MAG: hypothetical protein K0Q49_2263 [Haloplasmataceae bacterium]|jgi:hypothetical protein|nr:hypothetical protein [Haloplasmataceae bacterium]